MGAGFSAPFAVAALVLCVAGVAKLRSPATAARALRTVGLPSGALLIRIAAAGEIALGGWALFGPGPVSAGAVAALYVAFTLLSLELARRQVSCGCFGESEVPSSKAQSALSAVLGLIAVGAAIGSAHGLGWIFGLPAVRAVVLVIGICAAAYAVVLAYTELPRAWSAWSPR